MNDTPNETPTCEHDCDNDAVCLLKLNAVDQPVDACEGCAKDALFADPDTTTIVGYYE